MDPWRVTPVMNFGWGVFYIQHPITEPSWLSPSLGPPIMSIISWEGGLLYVHEQGDEQGLLCYMRKKEEIEDAWILCSMRKKKKIGRAHV